MYANMAMHRGKNKNRTKCNNDYTILIMSKDVAFRAFLQCIILRHNEYSVIIFAFSSFLNAQLLLHYWTQ